MLLNLIRWKKAKQKQKKSHYVKYILQQLFYKQHNIKEFEKRSLDLKRNDLIEFKDKLELFYHDTIEIKPNNADQINNLEKKL